jgi:hypothetical protein
MKQSDEFYKARDAIESGTYLKANFCKLRKYRKALNSSQLEAGESPWGSIFLSKWRSAVDKQIEEKKTKFRATGLSVVKLVLIGVLVGIILYFVYPLLPSNRDTQNITQPQPHQQKQKVPEPKATPSENKADQLKQKTK